MIPNIFRRIKMTTKWVLSGVALIGTLILGVGIYMLLHPKQEETSAQTSQSTQQNTSTSNDLTESVSVRSDRPWVDTDIKINKGDKITVQASGQINVATPGNGADKWVSPNGWGEIPPLFCNGQPCRYLYADNTSLGSLIGKIGNGKVFYVGNSKSFTASNDGNLFLGVNDGISDWTGRILPENELIPAMYSNNRGSFSANITVKQAIKPNVKITPVEPQNIRKTITVPANTKWFDTGLLVSNKQVKIQYKSGQWTNGGDTPLYADGRGAGPWEGLLVPNAPIRSLVAKTDSSTFYIGNSFEGNLGTGKLYYKY